MVLKLSVCFLYILVTVLCDENCFHRSETFVSKLNKDVALLQNEILESSSTIRDTVWNVMRMEMRVRMLRTEMESFLSIASTASHVGPTTPTWTMAQKSATLTSFDPKLNTVPTGSCDLQQLLNDHFNGSVSIEIKSNVPNPTKQPATTNDEISSCSKAPKTGVYRVKLSENVTTDLLCDADFDKGGWVVIQHRFNGSVDFFQNWTDYEDGFGKFDSEFWLGNKFIHLLTIGKPREIAFVMKDFDEVERIARYDSFQIGNRTQKYVLKSLGTFSGSAGDSLSRNVGSMFSARDMDNDRSDVHCAGVYFGGWWYDNCHLSNLNGKYLAGSNVYGQSMCWNSFRGLNYSLKSSRIMVRY